MIVRRIAAVSAGLAFALLVAAVLIWSSRIELAERLIRSRFDVAGDGALSFVVEEVSSDAIVLRDVRLARGDAPADLEIARLRMEVSATDLLASHARRIRVEGLRVRGVLDDAGLSFGLLDGWGASSEDEGANHVDTPPTIPALNPDALPAAVVEVDDGRIMLELASGAALIEVDRLAWTKQGDSVAIEIAARGHAPFGRAEAAEPGLETGVALARGRLRVEGSFDEKGGDARVEAYFESTQRGSMGEADEEAGGTRSVRVRTTGRFELEGGVVRFEPERCVRLTLSPDWFGAVASLGKPLVLCARAASPTAVAIAFSDAGRLALTADVELEPVALEGTVDDEPGSPRFEAELPRIRARVDGLPLGDPIVFDLETEGGRVHVPLYEFELEGFNIEARVALDGPGFDGSLVVDRIRNRVRPDRAPRLGALGRFTHRGGGEHDFSIRLADPGESLRIYVRGSHDFDEAAGVATVELETLRFEPGGLQPEALVQSLSDVVTNVVGELGIEGEFRWGRDGLHGGARVDVDGFGFESEWADVEGVYASLDFVGPFPFYNGEVQRIEVAQIETGLPLDAGVIDFALQRDGRVLLEQMEFGFAQGALFGNGTFDPLAEEHAFVLDVSEVRLEALLDLLELSGVSGSGLLEGSLPLRYTGRTLEVRDGILSSTPDGGRIRYRPDASAGEIAVRDEDVGMLVQVLEDFEFEVLSVELNGDVFEDVEVSLQLRGSNAAFQSGVPIEFNLVVEAAFADLLRGGMAAYSIPEVIGERIGAGQ